jgi:hypothetical protein
MSKKNLEKTKEKEKTKQHDIKKIDKEKEINTIKHLEYMNDLTSQINKYKEFVLKEIYNNYFKTNKNNKIKDYKEFKKLIFKLNREDK